MGDLAIMNDLTLKYQGLVGKAGFKELIEEFSKKCHKREIQGTSL